MTDSIQFDFLIVYHERGFDWLGTQQQVFKAFAHERKRETESARTWIPSDKSNSTVSDKELSSNWKMDGELL